MDEYTGRERLVGRGAPARVASGGQNRVSELHTVTWNGCFREAPG